MGGFLISERAKELVAQVLDSGRLTAGPMISRFEAEVARLHGCELGLMCSSGTAALQIALAALKEREGWAAGDEVLVPAVTFVATSNVVLYNGLVPIFVDVEPDYYTLDPMRLEECLTPRTRAIMPVHVAGLPCAMREILAFARLHDLRVVEDCAEAMFASYEGQPVGALGDVGAFSTYAAHIVSTGVGGLCTTNDPDLMARMTSFMNHGRDLIYIRIDDDRASEDESLFDVVDRRFTFVRSGHSFRVTEMEAALGIAQLEDREQLRRRRNEIVAHYEVELSPLAALQLPKVRPGCEPAHMFYPIVLQSPTLRRDDLVLHLEQAGIETRYLLPLIDQPIYRHVLVDAARRLPVASRLNRDAFYVGCHPEMSDHDVHRVIAAFHDFFERYP